MHHIKIHKFTKYKNTQYKIKNKIQKHNNTKYKNTKYKHTNILQEKRHTYIQKFNNTRQYQKTMQQYTQHIQNNTQNMYTIHGFCLLVARLKNFIIKHKTRNKTYKYTIFKIYTNKNTQYNNNNN